MALATNTRYQLAERLQADLQLTNGMTVTVSQAAGTALPAAGDPLLLVKNSAGTNIALIAIDQLTFNGFNVVAELSSSAAVGLPEHQTYMLVNSGATQLDAALLVATTKRLGTAVLALGFVAVGSLTEANLTAANISYSLPNDARLGASGA